jgi:hypothetical protein
VKNNKEHVFYSNCSSWGHTVAARLNCSREFTRAIFDHLEFSKIWLIRWSFLLAPGDKVVAIIAFGRGFGCWGVFWNLTHKGILCFWLSFYGLLQFSPVLTVRAQFVWLISVLVARLMRCWLHLHVQFRLSFYTSAGYHYRISLITIGEDFGKNELGLRLMWNVALISTISWHMTRRWD